MIRHHESSEAGRKADDVSPSRDGIVGDRANAALTDDESGKDTEYQCCDEGCRRTLWRAEHQAEQAVADEPGDHQREQPDPDPDRPGGDDVSAGVGF
jgi:hypothetical protein